jgi:hypothetical protein
VHADNHEGHIVGGRAVSEGGHAIEDVLFHFREWPRGRFTHDFAEAIDAQVAFMRIAAFGEAIRINRDAVVRVQRDFGGCSVATAFSIRPSALLWDSSNRGGSPGRTIVTGGWPAPANSRMRPSRFNRAAAKVK